MTTKEDSHSYHHIINLVHVNTIVLVWFNGECYYAYDTLHATKRPVTNRLGYLLQQTVFKKQVKIGSTT